jgi:hypothetical protein
MTDILTDQQEGDPALRPIFEAVEQEVQEKLKGFPFRLGYCHVAWAEKKRLLKEKYGIDWQSPAELNPEVCFD